MVLKDLFDVSFQKSVTIRVVGALYLGWIMCLTAGTALADAALLVKTADMWKAGQPPPATLWILIASPFALLASVLLSRIVAEYVVVQFRIAGRLDEIRASART